MDKVGQSHSRQSGALKIDEDIAQVNQLTTRLGIIKYLAVEIYIAAVSEPHVLLKDPGKALRV